MPVRTEGGPGRRKRVPNPLVSPIQPLPRTKPKPRSTPQPSPDVRDRIEASRRANIRRGAAPSGGPKDPVRNSVARRKEVARAFLGLDPQRAVETLGPGAAWDALVLGGPVRTAISQGRSKREAARAEAERWLEEQKGGRNPFDLLGRASDAAQAAADRVAPYLTPEAISEAMPGPLERFMFGGFPGGLALDPIAGALRKTPEDARLGTMQLPLGSAPGLPAGAIAHGTATLIDRTVQDVYNMTVGAPGGTIQAIAHPVQAAQAIKQDYSYRYGPLFSGDFATFAKRNAEHPVFFALDLASVLQLGASTAAKAGIVTRAPKVRSFRVHEGEIQPWRSPNEFTAQGQHWFDRFSERFPDAPVVGAKQRAAKRIPHELDLRTDIRRARASSLENAASRLRGPERVAYDVMARYGDQALAFVDMEIAGRRALMTRPGISRKERVLQNAQITALEESKNALLHPRQILLDTVEMGRSLAGETEQMLFDLKLLTPETAERRVGLSARIWGELPSTDEVAAKLRFYALAKERLSPEQADAAVAAADAFIRALAEAKGMDAAGMWRAAFSAEKARLSFDPGDLDPTIPDNLSVLYQDRPPLEALDLPPLDPQAVAALANHVRSNVKLPRQLRPAGALEDAIPRLYELTKQGTPWRDWYTRYAGIMTKTASDLGVPPRQFAQLVAIYSPRANPTENLRRALMFVKDRNFKSLGGENQRQKAISILEDPDWFEREYLPKQTNPKTANYYLNALEDIDPEHYARIVGDRKPVTVDTHMINAMLDDMGSTKGISPSYYEGFAEVFRGMADQLGMSPREVQASIWVAWKARNEAAAVANKGKVPKPAEQYMPAAGDAYERGYAKYKGTLFQGGMSPDELAAFNARMMGEAFNERTLSNDIPELSPEANAAVKKGVASSREEGGGFTWNGDLTEDTGNTGYAVSIEGHERPIPVDRFDETDVAQFWRERKEMLDAESDLKVGAWNDEGNVVLDLTRVVADHDTAMRVAQYNGQKAIYSRRTGKVLDVPLHVPTRAPFLVDPESGRHFLGEPGDQHSQVFRKAKMEGRASGLEFDDLQQGDIALVGEEAKLWQPTARKKKFGPEGEGLSPEVEAALRAEARERWPIDTQVFHQRKSGEPIKGWVEVEGQEPVRVGATEAADVSTFIHEPAHILRRFMPDDQLVRVEKILGVKNGRWTRANEEAFARTVEGYFYRGETPNPKLRYPMLELRNGMRPVYGTPPGIRGPGRQQLFSVLDELFDPSAGLKPGDGAFFMPDVPSWRGRGAGGGRRASLAGRRRKEVRPTRGILQLEGRIARGPKQTVQDFYRRAKLYEHRMALSDADEFAIPLDPDAHPSTGGVRPGYRLYNPDGFEIQRILRETPTHEDVLAMFPDELALEVQKQYDDLLAGFFPDPEAPNLPPEIKQIPKEIAEAFEQRKVGVSMSRYPAVDRLVRTLDTTNAIAKAAMIYMKLSYIPLNFAGNVFFLTIAAGPWAGPALARASRALKAFNPEDYAAIDARVGEGSLAALTMEESRGAVARSVQKLGHWQSSKADRLPRRAAWIYFAAKEGFRKPEDVRMLLDDANANKVWKDGITYRQIDRQITESAEKAMVQFRGMSPFQREVISRGIFIYGWMRGAAKYTARMPLDRPIRADLLAHLGQQETDRIEEMFGNLVSYMDGLHPVGDVERMLGLEVVPARNLRGINPVSTGGEALMALYNLATGDPEAAGPDIADYIAPFPKAIGELVSGYNWYFGEKYDNRWEAIYGSPMRYPPIVVGRELIDPTITDADVAGRDPISQPNYIVPDRAAARRDLIEYIFMGSARKRYANIAAAQARGRAEDEGADKYKSDLAELQREAKEFGLGEIPTEVANQLKWRIDMEKGMRNKSYRERAKRAAEVWAEAFGDKSLIKMAEGLDEAESQELYLDIRREMFRELNEYENEIDNALEDGVGG